MTALPSDYAQSQAETEKAVKDAQSQLENEAKSTADEEKKAISDGIQSLKRGLFGN